MIIRMSAYRNNNGLSLIEVMISLTITLLLFLALMQTAMLSITQNTRNSIRDEAVDVATLRMREARNTPIKNIDGLESDPNAYNGPPENCPDGFIAARCGGRGVLVERDVRKIEDFDFCTCMIVNSPVGITDYRQVNIFVGWRWSGEGYTHAISSIVRQQ